MTNLGRPHAAVQGPLANREGGAAWNSEQGDSTQPGGGIPTVPPPRPTGDVSCPSQLISNLVDAALTQHRRDLLVKDGQVLRLLDELEQWVWWRYVGVSIAPVDEVRWRKSEPPFHVALALFGVRAKRRFFRSDLVSHPFDVVRSLS